MIFGHKEYKIKERLSNGESLTSTEQDDPFRKQYLQNNPEGNQNLKPVYEWRFFTFLGIPIFPLYCIQSLWKDPQGEYYERKSTFIGRIVNWWIINWVITQGFILIWIWGILFLREESFRNAIQILITLCITLWASLIFIFFRHEKKLSSKYSITFFLMLSFGILAIGMRFFLEYSGYYK